jgi:Transposase DDE domain
MAGVYNNQMKPLDWKKVDGKLKKANADSIELDVLLYEKHQIPCRLIIERVSDKEYCRRLEKAKSIAKSKGIGVSALHKIKLSYNVFITNVDSSVLPISTIRKTYYLRWQIELIFKTWKSFFEINKVKRVKKERMECMVLAKLIWILINWQLFKRCNDHVRKMDAEKGVSILIFFKRCLKFKSTPRLVLLKRFSLTKWLRDIYLPLIINALCEAPGKKKNITSL